MHYAVLSGFILALAAPVLQRLTRSLAGWVFALLPAGLFVYFAGFIPRIAAGESLAVRLEWVPSLGLNLAFNLDGLSLLFALLITGIGALIMVYAGGYLAGHAQLGRFYAYLSMFMASMLGVVLADNLLLLFVFWELTSISSYLLIGFEHQEAEARASALQALLVTGGGGLAMLAGFVLLGQAGTSYDLSALALEGEALRAHPLYLPALLLVLLGAFTKSAQAPFHFWLPNAMAAPTPVSAYLHSATMVKAGIYLLARLFPLLGGTEAWFYLVGGVGLATSLTGAYLALNHTQLKRILAYSTISSLGTMTMLIGMEAEGAVQSAVVYLLAHALYKGALFMIAGALYHETGAQAVDAMGGLWRKMQLLAATTGLAALSLLGFGPLLSFIGKEMLLEALLHAPRFGPVLVVSAVATAAINAAVALILFLRPFLGAFKPTPRPPHEPPLSLGLGPGLLALAGIILGLFPALIAGPVVTPAVQAILRESEPVKLALWHGLNTPLLLSVVSLLLGLLLYRLWAGWRRLAGSVGRLLTWGPARLYSVSLDFLPWFSGRLTNLLQSGHLHNYLVIITATTVLLTGFTLLYQVGVFHAIPWPAVRFYEVILAFLMLAAALAVTRSRSRLAAVAALGVVGYGVSLIFILFGAPDLAMTQILIETVTVILLVLILYHLPGFERLSSRPARIRDAVIAVAAGGLMTALVLIASSARPSTLISDFYIENSLPLAHGRNIVNVILVDFRALDTMGEITVLSLAAIGVYSLLKLRWGGRMR